VALGTPTLLQLLPRQKGQANPDTEDDLQDLEPESATSGAEIEVETADDNQPDNQTMLRLLEEGETVSQ